jgi:hypothetical protein
MGNQESSSTTRSPGPTSVTTASHAHREPKAHPPAHAHIPHLPHFHHAAQIPPRSPPARIHLYHLQGQVAGRTPFSLLHQRRDAPHVARAPTHGCQPAETGSRNARPGPREMNRHSPATTLPRYARTPTHHAPLPNSQSPKSPSRTRHTIKTSHATCLIWTCQKTARARRQFALGESSRFRRPNETTNNLTTPPTLPGLLGKSILISIYISLVWPSSRLP